MQECRQTPTQTIYQHGVSVKEHLFDLINLLKTGKSEREFKLPDWFFNYKNEILSELLPESDLALYTVFHDCGKPYCRTVDKDGKQHFPNHAKASHDIWLEAGGSEEVARLILMDMDIHTLKADGVEEFAERPEAISFLLTGLAEIHSNAAMFGGIKSTSFKIKWKQIDKRGKQILERKFGAKKFVEAA